MSLVFFVRKDLAYRYLFRFEGVGAHHFDGEQGRQAHAPL